MPNPYPFELSVGGVVKESGDLTFTDSGNQPGGGSIPDPITTPVNIAPTSPTAVALTVTSGAAEAAGADVFVVSNADTDLLVEFASDGTFFFTMQPDSAGFKINGTATTFVATRDNKLGFFGHAAAARPAAPVTLGDVIAALQALGLVGT